MICFSKSAQPFLFFWSLAITVTTKYYQQHISYSSEPKKLYLLRIPKWWQERLKAIFRHFNSNNPDNYYYRKHDNYLAILHWFRREQTGEDMSLFVHMTFLYYWFTESDSQNSHRVEQAVLMQTCACNSCSKKGHKRPCCFNKRNDKLDLGQRTLWYCRLSTRAGFLL